MTVPHDSAPGDASADFDALPLFAGLSPACCLVLDRDGLRAVMRDDPAVAWIFLRRLSARVRHLVERLDRASSQTVPSRLAAFIVARAASARSDTFTLGLTQADLAEELGTVREVTVRALARLRDAGLIESVGRGRYAVKDRAALEELAAS